MTKLYEVALAFRSGEKLEASPNDGSGAHPVHGATKEKNGQWFPSSWTSNGAYLTEGEIRNNDLVLVPKRHTQEVWINIYPGRVIRTFESAQDARVARGNACIKVELDFEEGQGL